MIGLKGAIDYQQISIMNTSTNHGVAFHAQEEGGLGMQDQVFIEIKALVVMIGSRRWKAGRSSTGNQGQSTKPMTGWDK
jgi:hypothetical protein